MKRDPHHATDLCPAMRALMAMPEGRSDQITRWIDLLDRRTAPRPHNPVAADPSTDRYVLPETPRRPRLTLEG